MGSDGCPPGPVKPGVPMKNPAAVQRRLAAILCADVAGYARLMNADEAGTLRLLTFHRSMTDRLIAQHNGRIANTAGDSVLAEFPSAVDALQCAIGIQERVAAVNREVAEDRRVSFRIGLHVGEAMIRDGDMFGDGVNVAARMQELAQPGSVCLSGAAYEYVHKPVPLAYSDLGLQRVKNLDAPIQAYMVHPPGPQGSRALPPVHRIEVYLARRFQEVCLAAVSAIAGPEGLVSFETGALASINDAPGIDQRRLAERLGIDLARARRLVSKLERRGLVERMPVAGSPRSAALRLTPEGQAVIERLIPTIRAALERVMAPLSDAERETLKDLLTRIVKADEVRADTDGCSDS